MGFAISGVWSAVATPLAAALNTDHDRLRWLRAGTGCSRR